MTISGLRLGPTAGRDQSVKIVLRLTLKTFEASRCAMISPNLDALASWDFDSDSDNPCQVIVGRLMRGG